MLAISVPKNMMFIIFRAANDEWLKADAVSSAFIASPHSPSTPREVMP